MFYLRVWDGESMHYLTPEETDDAVIFRSQQHFEGDVELVMLGSEVNGVVVYDGDLVSLYDSFGYREAKEGVVKSGQGKLEIHFMKQNERPMTLDEVEEEYNVYIDGNIYEN